MTATEFDILQPWPKDLDPLILDLYKILHDADALPDFQSAISHALRKNVQDLKELNIHHPSDYIRFMSSLLRWVPEENKDGTWVNVHLSIFYWIFNLPPLSQNTRVQSPIHPASAGKPLAPVTAWLVRFAAQMGEFLSTPASWPPGAEDNFRNAKGYNVDWYKGPWTTFNDFFRRHLKEPRSIDGAPGDDRVIVSAADSTYKSPLVDVDKNSDINVKGLLWNIDELLSAAAHICPPGTFAGGKFIHSYLAPYDYHRQHAPVAGIVREAKVVQGQCYLQVDLDEEPAEGGAPRLRPVRPIPPPGEKKPTSDEVDELDAPDVTGYQFLQSRGVLVIENENLGFVACLPIGMSQVSSVKFEEGIKPGKRVEKGEPISWFEFGGSDFIMVFQEKAGVELVVDTSAEEPPHVLQGRQVLRANYK